MKVKIGPYLDWIGPYQISEFLLTPLTWFKPKRKSKLEQALSNERDPHDELCHKFGEWLSTDKNGQDNWFTKNCQWIHSKKHRKVKIHIDKWDTWNMNSTLAMIILPMLKQLKATKHGSPFVEAIDVPEHLWAAEEPSDENDWVDNTHHERWEWVMDELIWTFEQICDDDNDAQFHSGTSEFFFQPVDEKGNVLGDPEPIGKKNKNIKADYYQMVKGPNDTSVFDTKGFEAHQKRIANGLRLFGKYYLNLWD